MDKFTAAGLGPHVTGDVSSQPAVGQSVAESFFALSGSTDGDGSNLKLKEAYDVFNYRRFMKSRIFLQ